MQLRWCVVTVLCSRVSACTPPSIKAGIPVVTAEFVLTGILRQFIQCMPRKRDPFTIVVSCAEDASACRSAIKAGIPVVTAEFVLTGILRQVVDIQALCDTGN